MESFGERIPRTLVIKSILDSYTFGNGILRELLQNSDDAGAIKQVFTLDKRSFGTYALADKGLASTQGPALISFNDTIFGEKDWNAIRTIHGSSKVADATQIGKYGIGFRSVYHVTDTPQILSGDSLVIFDPHERLEEFNEGGVRIPIKTFNSVEDQIRAFQSVDADLNSPFRGTAVRLPLRTSEDAQWSQIKPGVSTSVEQVSDLFVQFVEQELSTVLLFLKHIKSIELWIFDEGGKQTLVGNARIDGSVNVLHRCFSPHSNCPPPRYTLSITSQNNFGREERRDWFICHALASEDAAARYLEKEYRGPVQGQLKKDKLYSHVMLAAPLDSKHINGQLFTLLPLPIRTGFPLHINGIFALTPDRQNLRKNDPGLVNNSPDRLRALWNGYLFHSVIPETWAKAIHALTCLDKRPRIFNMLPPLDAGDVSAPYWNGILIAVLQHLMEVQLPVWPAYSQDRQKPRFLPLDSLLIIPPGLSKNINLCNALSSASLDLLAIPEKYVNRWNAITSIKGVRILTPLEAGAILRKHDVGQLSSSEKRTILEFLLSTDEPEAVHGLPLVPTVSGEYVALHCNTMSPQSGDTLTLADGDAIRLFAQLIPSMIDITQDTISSHLRQAYLRAAKARSLNVQVTNPEVVCSAVQRMLGHSGASSDAVAGAVDWLLHFWSWVVHEHGDWHGRLEKLLAGLHVLPTDRNILCRMDAGAIEIAPDDHTSRAVLAALEVPTLHPQLPTLLNFGGRPTSDLAFILDKSHPEVEIKMRASVQRFFGERVQNASYTQYPIHRLRALPLYRMLSQGDTVDAHLAPLPPRSSPRIILVSGWTSLPEKDDVVFLDGNDTYTRRFLQIVDPATPRSILHRGHPSILTMAIDAFEEQSKPVQEYFAHATLDYLNNNPEHGDLWVKFCSVPFVPTGDGTELRPPKEVIDPHSKELTDIFPANHSRLARYRDDPLMRKLHVLEMLVGSATGEILVERLEELSDAPPAAQENLHKYAIALVGLLNRCEYGVLSSCWVALKGAWLPVNGRKALCAPADCWDDGLLCDQILPVVTTTVSDTLHRLLWDKRIDMSIVSRQCLALSKLGDANRLESLIRHLGAQFYSTNAPRSLDELDTLAHLIGNCPWLPTSRGKLVSSNYALINDRSCGKFRQIRESLRTLPALLCRLGCHETLNNDVILAELQNQSARITETIDLLRRIKSPLDEESKKRLKVPCSDNAIRQADEVYFADHVLGDVYHARGLSRHRAHPGVSHELATSLGITMLSELILEEDNEDPDDFSPSVDMRAFVSATLKEYSFKYSFNEFVANADDAGASEITFTIDEQLYPKKSLVNEQLSSLHEVPALLVQNDSVFSPADLEGIRKVGVGSKAHEPQKIGRMGVGILSMYFWTDLPCLLTGENMIWFDPSGHNLPKYRGRERNGLKIPISQVRDMFREHLSPFHDTVRLNENDLKYTGSVFRLALRKPGANDKQRIRDNDHDAASVLCELNEYYSIAQQSLFFLSSVRSIKAVHRTKDGTTRDLWRVSRGSTTALNDRFTELSLKLMPPRSPATSDHDQLWLIATDRQALRGTDYPLTTTYRVPQEVSCAIAVRIDKDCPEDTTHRLFAGLPLPEKFTLPVHLHGSFIPWQNRRSVALMPETSPEASYNRWILTDMAARLYVLVYAELKRRPLRGPKREQRWWTPSEHSDNIASIILNALETGQLQSTNSLICRSLTGELLAPKDATFLPSEDDEADTRLRRFLKRCGPSLVVPTFPFRQAMREKFRHQYLDSTRFRLLIQNLPTDRLSSVIESPGLLGAAILYFHRINPSLETLAGLPVLPLRDGSNVPVPSRDDPPIYVSDLPVSRIVCEYCAPRFSRLQPDDPCTEMLVSCPNVNLKHFDSMGMRDLLITQCDVGSNFSAQFQPVKSRWLRDLWAEMPNLTEWRDDLIDLAIIPTTRPWVFVSHQALDSDVALAWDDSPVSSIIPAISGLGLHIVDHNAIRKHHRVTLTAPNPMSLLNVMFNNKLQITGTEPQWPIVARFLRDCVVGYSSSDLINYFKLLPMWEVASTSSIRLVSSVQLVLLPPEISMDSIRAFMADGIYYAEYSGALRHLLTIENPRNPTVIHEVETLMTTRLSIPLQLTEREVLLYSELLIHARGGADIRIPDGNGRLVPYHSLYDPNNATFTSAFALPRSAAQRFPHRGVRDALRSAGRQLITNLDCQSAIHCAEGIDAQVSANENENHPGELMARASLVYGAINDLHRSALGTGEWLRLRDLRFIPRADQRFQRLGLDPVTQSATVVNIARDLPQIVSLNDLVLPNDKAEAMWTQKASFMTEPTPGFTRLVQDVRQHLCHPVLEQLVALSRFARENEVIGRPNCHAIHLSITAGYDWLNEHASDEETRTHLRQRAAAEPIFLNVQDPQVHALGDNWRTASQLVVDLEYDTFDKYDVGTFLARFPLMLEAAGVERVRRRLYTPESVKMNENDLTSRFETFRQGNLYIDAYLATPEAPSSRYPVHAVFLAACVDHLKKLLEWERGGADDPLVIEGITDFSLRNVIGTVGSSRVDLQACKLEYSIVSPK